VYTGTNGQVFSAVVTNTQFEEGRTSADYMSWDTLRCIITNLVLTANAMTWTNNGAANVCIGRQIETNSVRAVGQPYTPAMDLIEESISNAVTEADADFSGGLHLLSDPTHRPYQETKLELLPLNAFNFDYYGWAELTSLKNYGSTVLPANPIDVTGVIYAAKIGALPYFSYFRFFGDTNVVSSQWVFVTNASASQLTNDFTTVLAPQPVPLSHDGPMITEYGCLRYDGQYYYWNYPTPTFTRDPAYYGWSVIDEKALVKWDFEYK
jgi:hypothetical protein